MALDFIGGWAGGAAGVLAGYPLDTVKVKIQTSSPGTYRGTFDCLRKVAAKEGVKGLYRGISSPLLGVAGINAITFGVNAQVLQLLSNPESLSSVTLAGASAGLIQTAIVSPMELVKTQMQVCGQKDIQGAVSNILNNAGLKGLFRGLAITATREVPAFAIYFSSYEVIVRRFGDSTAIILFAGGMAGVFSWIFTYPQDVIKSRLQADSFGANQLYRSSRHCLQESLKSEGPNVLVRGIGSTIIRAFPMNAVTFGVYSFIIKKWGYKVEDMEYDTVENLQKRLGSGICEVAQKLPNPWKEIKDYKRLSTLVTDGPNIITIQEPMISSISHIRMYPEQMLWACTESPKKEEELTVWNRMVDFNNATTFSTYTYCNFNQFTQRNLRDAYQNLPDVVPPPTIRNIETPVDSEPIVEELEPKIPSLLSTEETCPKRISTQDFLIPTNLLSSRKSPDRIYGFYYLIK